MTSWKGALTKVWREMEGDHRTELAEYLRVPKEPLEGTSLSVYWEREYVRASKELKRKLQPKAEPELKCDCGKTKYKGKKSALVHASRYSKGLYLRVYRCPREKGIWHLTKKRSWK